MSVEEKTQTDEQRRKAAESLREHDRTAAQAQEVKSPYQSGAELDGTYTIQEARDRAAHTPGLQERGEPSAKEMERDLKEYDAWAKQQGRDTWGGGLNEKDVNHLHEQDEKSTKGGHDRMTPEQQERVDTSLKNANIQRESMGGASDVNSKPTPNDPTSMDKARDIGRDLNKSGVEMER
jgi:hypothetical protein